jgi:hypothetical protein
MGLAEVGELAKIGRVKADTLVWRPGMAEWLAAINVPEVAAFMTLPPPGTARASVDPALKFVLPIGRSVWAIAAGYLALFSLALPFGPFALVCGLMGLREIRRNPGLGGRGRAWFGIVLGTLNTLMYLFVILAMLFAD